MLSRFRELIWADWIWFPEGHSWEELKDHDGKVFPKIQDLWASIPVAFLFLVGRRIFDWKVAKPLAALLGVDLKHRVSASQNPTLESHFCQYSKHPTQKPWFQDIRKVWEDFPKMPLLASQYWYYMIELGFYLSLLFSVASDVKRKDFWEQIVHHVVTIVLISFSWLVNYVRAGSLIMLVHDAADYLMELAKMFNYAGWKRTCNFLFVAFAAVFVITRLMILPVWIVFMTLTFPVARHTPFFGVFFFDGLLFVLQILHFFWAGLILRMAIKFLPGSDIVEDERSDKEETESDEDEDPKRHEKQKNGHVKNGYVLAINHHSKTD